MSWKKEDLYDLIKDLFNLDKIPTKIVKQVNNYILDYDMNYKEIARCLIYWTEVKRQKMNLVYGIGIVPSIREDAAKYFEKLKREKEEQQKNAEQTVKLQDNNIIFNIKSVKTQKRRIPQYDLNEIDIGDDDDGNE